MTPASGGGASGPTTLFKYSGAGNDFIVLDARHDAPGDLGSLARALCRRGLSVGADGLVLVEPLQAEGPEGPHVRMRLWNADGSQPAISGNAARCACRHAVEEGLAPRDLVLLTDAGPVAGVVDGRDVAVRLPGVGTVETNVRLRVEGREVVGVEVEVGVPFFVLFHDDPDDLPVRFLGRAIRDHSEFPDGANVAFVRVDDEQELYLRIYERGVEAETLSSGTGCISAALAAGALGRGRSPVACRTRGGTLTVRYAPLAPEALAEHLGRADAASEDAASGGEGDGDGGDASRISASPEAGDTEKAPERVFGFAELELRGETRRIFRADVWPDALL